VFLLFESFDGIGRQDTGRSAAAAFVAGKHCSSSSLHLCVSLSVQRASSNKQGEPGDGAVPEVRGDAARPRREQPFSPAEEEAGVVDQIVRLCSIENLKSLEVNKGGSFIGGNHFAIDWFFRKGGAGDWANHMTPDMARRLDAIAEEKLSGSGLSFA
jgi:hypothetical protein